MDQKIKLTEPVLTLQDFADQSMQAVVAVLVRHIQQHDCGPDCEILAAMKQGQLLRIQVTDEKLLRMRAFSA